MNPDDLQKILDYGLGVKMSLHFDDSEGAPSYFGVWVSCSQEVFDQLQGKESSDPDR